MRTCLLVSHKLSHRSFGRNRSTSSIGYHLLHSCALARRFHREVKTSSKHLGTSRHMDKAQRQWWLNKSAGDFELLVQWHLPIEVSGARSHFVEELCLLSVVLDGDEALLRSHSTSPVLHPIKHPPGGPLLYFISLIGCKRITSRNFFERSFHCQTGPRTASSTAFAGAGVCCGWVSSNAAAGRQCLNDPKHAQAIEAFGLVTYLIGCLAPLDLEILPQESPKQTVEPLSRIASTVKLRRWRNAYAWKTDLWLLRGLLPTFRLDAKAVRYDALPGTCHDCLVLRQCCIPP